MSKKFLNISTDNTLGGNFPSDSTVASQKAVKKYVDTHSSNISIDNTTITKNSSDELQAVATVNQNPASGATNPVYDWVGTLAEYQAQNIETLHPDWICYITDDVSGGASVYTKAQVDNMFSDMLNAIWPVTSIYIGTQSTCPMATLISGSTWELVSSGKALWTGNGTSGSGTTSTSNYANAPANTTIAAGLPDHKHAVSKQYGTSDQASGDGVDGTAHKVGTMSMTCGNASADNSIYGNSSTVQPPAYVVNVWRRTA